jgi:hypothetical protein
MSFGDLTDVVDGEIGSVTGWMNVGFRNTREPLLLSSGLARKVVW